MAFSRMNDHPRRFVDGDQVVVFVDDLQGDVFADRRRWGRRGKCGGDDVSGFQAVGGAHRLVVDLDVASFDQALDVGAAVGGELAAEEDVDADALVERAGDPAGDRVRFGGL